jgi:hypothetical protein
VEASWKRVTSAYSALPNQVDAIPFHEGKLPGIARTLFPCLESMEVHLTNPDLRQRLDRWVTETGRGPDELVEDAMAGYFDELAQTREMLVTHLREKSAAARRTQPALENISKDEL